MISRKVMVTLVTLIGLIGLLLVNVGGASGLHTVAEEPILRLHLDTDADSDGDTDYFKHGDTKQPLDASQCLVDGSSQTGPLVSFPGTTKLGLSFDSLGVRSKGPGRSCGRVDGNESFSISINNASGDILDGLNFDRMELDIEAKQDAWVLATAKLGGDPIGTFELRSGGSVVAGDGTDPNPSTPWLAVSTSAAPVANCLDRSDSGSDNGANDNCRWVVDPDVPFDTVTFEAMAGEFGLEGGEDGTLPATAGENSDSLFYLTDVGVLNCGDTVTTDDLGDPAVSVTRKFQDGCKLKEFLLSSSATLPIAGAQSFTFVPSGGEVGQAGATYDLTVIWVPETAQNPVPATQMDFNSDGDTLDALEGDLVWCEGTTDAPVLPQVEVTPEVFETIPWCLVKQLTEIVGGGQMQVTEYLFGTEDPSGFR